MARKKLSVKESYVKAWRDSLVGSMALCMQENLSLKPVTCDQMPGAVADSCNLRAGEEEAGRSQGFTDQLVQLLGELLPNERLCQNKNGRRCLRENS